MRPGAWPIGVLAVAIVLGAVGAIAALSTAWRGGLDIVRDPGADIGVYFPRSAGPIEGAWMAAAFEAILVRSDGCLWMENDGMRRLPIWPPYTRPELVDGLIQVRSHDGGVIAIEGGWFRGGGGERDVPGDVPTGQVPEPCRSEIYWIMSPCATNEPFCGVGRRTD